MKYTTLRTLLFTLMIGGVLAPCSRAQAWGYVTLAASLSGSSPMLTLSGSAEMNCEEDGECDYDAIAIYLDLEGPPGESTAQYGAPIGTCCVSGQTQLSVPSIPNGAGYYDGTMTIEVLEDNSWEDGGGDDTSGEMATSSANYNYTSCSSSACSYAINTGCTSTCFKQGTNKTISNPRGTCSPNTCPSEVNFTEYVWEGQGAGNSCIAGTVSEVNNPGSCN